MTALRIYVANLGKYNEGELVGEWLDLPATEEQEKALLKRIGINKEYEEYAIHDYESDFSGVEVSEYDHIDTLSELAERLEEIEDTDAFEAILQYHCGDIEKAFDTYEEGEWTFYADCTDHQSLGEHLVEEGLWGEEVPEWAKSYLDYAKIGRDADYGGTGTFCGNGFLEVE